MSRLGRVVRLGALTSRVAGRGIRSRAKQLLKDGRISAPNEDELDGEQAHDIAKTLSRLKGVAMKAGQQLAVAAVHLDLPDEVRSTLERLHSNAEAIPFDQIKNTLESELDGPIGQHFAWVDPRPLGTASLAQAHAAQTKDGRSIVLKVMHDGVHESLETDLLTLRGIMLSSRAFGRSGDEVSDLFEEVAEHLRAELDYLQEAVNIHAFSKIFADDDRFLLPAIHPEWCTERVLAMDRLEGVSLRQFIERGTSQARQRAGMSLAEWFFESTFHHRILHADPHPGNFLFCDDGRVGVVDFGCVKRFDEFFLGRYGQVVLDALEGKHSEVLEGCIALGVWDGEREEAGQAVLNFCDTLVEPWRHGPTIIGVEHDLVQRVRPAAKQIWRYPEIRGARDMVMLHRTLGGLYAIARDLRVEGDWAAMLRTHLQHAIDVSNGALVS